jgi:hypothetical protein
MDYGTLNNVKGVADGHRAELHHQAEAERLIGRTERRFEGWRSRFEFNLNTSSPQIVRTFWWVPAGFAVFFLLRIIIGA